MRGVFYILSVFAVMGLAVWAYGQNNLTQQARNEVRDLRREIVSLREAMSVQRAEWAYLNRPERLRQLVEMNRDRLGLLPLRGSQFVRLSDIPFPGPMARAEDQH